MKESTKKKINTISSMKSKHDLSEDQKSLNTFYNYE